jgi:hypothetical protein
MAKYPRVQLIITCKTCDETIRFSIYYGENQIWNNKDAEKMHEWARHVSAGHEVVLEYDFYEGWGY